MPRPGTRHHFAKMDDAKVADVRIRYTDGGVSQLELATEYGVDQSTMGIILRSEGWKHVGKAPVARKITVDSDSGYRAALQFRIEETDELVMYYEGIYDKIGTVNQRLSFWRNVGKRWFYDGPDWNKTNERLGILVDSWPEKATITWGKEDE